MKRLLALFGLLLLLLLTGCLPLRQSVQVAGPEHPSLLLCDNRYLLAGLDLQHERFDTGQSHITDPKGRRYRIEVEPHTYDSAQNLSFLRAEVYPIAPNGSRLRSWQNGLWSFHWVIETNGVAQTIDQRWKYWTFYYNPIVHGAPN